jgi:hypothetical protein
MTQSLESRMAMYQREQSDLILKREQVELQLGKVNEILQSLNIQFLRELRAKGKGLKGSMQ